MYNIYFAAAFTFTVMLNNPSYSQETKPYASKKNTETMAKETVMNKEIIRNLYENIMNGRHLDQLGAAIDENYTGIRGDKGPEGFKQVIEPLIAAFPDIQWHIEDLLADDNKVIVRWKWNGTFKNPFRGISPNQKQFTNEAIVIYELANGKALKAWIQSDQLGFLTQAEVISPSILPGAPKK
jgi:predicted ester cyclase